MPKLRTLELMTAVVPRHQIVKRVGRIRSLSANLVSVSGLSDVASVGHRVAFPAAGVHGEVISIGENNLKVLPDGALSDLRIGQAVQHLGEVSLYPDDSWLGRVIDGEGRPLDGEPLVNGPTKVGLHRPPPPAADRLPQWQWFSSSTVPSPKSVIYPGRPSM